jgi:hypothetical protein
LLFLLLWLLLLSFVWLRVWGWGGRSTFWDNLSEPPPWRRGGWGRGGEVSSPYYAACFVWEG